jgi:quercetin dioxygenase-like cupin family protein
MTRTLTLRAALFALSGCTSVTSMPVSQAITSEVLLKTTSSWDGTPYTRYPAGQPELTILRIRVPANAALKWHRHPVPNAAYVVSGRISVQARNSLKTIELKAGDTLAEMVDSLHRGVTGDEPVELIVFYAGSPTMPLSQ